ncbi:hypothetical protein M8Z33_14400 [Streptomyces sp. ZAF1911]|uniref:hypothetical protein n=1 Tax=Streptomyces sp. ZAF1911 TaxID=2944129 RepID=UPI00237BF613|nr:hypothetical protein [Streptomyces sp. ZAF1911]MDD9377829.1 hypothetical protein [Streptomyces sp. ZAF1911]
MSEDRKKNEAQGQEQAQELPGADSGGLEALRALVLGEASTPDTASTAEAPDTVEAPDMTEAQDKAEAPDTTEAQDTAEVPDTADDAGSAQAGTAQAGTEESAAEAVVAEPAAPKLALVKPAAGTAPAASAPVAEEDVLRDLLHGVVGGIEPSGNALERLRYAVPARRVRNRRILVAAAAAVVVLGGGIPVSLLLASGTGGNSDRSTMAGHGQKGGDSKDGSGLHQNGSGSRPKPKKTSGKDKDKDGKDKTDDGDASTLPPLPDGGYPSVGGPNVTPPRAPSPIPGTTGSVGGGIPPASVVVPNCAQSQISVAGSTKAASAGGKIAGGFKVTNVSSSSCTVRGPESLVAGPAYQGGAPVTVVNHVTGDAATGLLPDPSVETLRLVLAPNAQYEVRFAWVPPEGGCPSANGAGGNPPEGGSGDTSGTGTDTGQGQAAVPPLGALVAHTPNPDGPDGPTTQLTLAEACGGTVYRTGVIPIK